MGYSLGGIFLVKFLSENKILNYPKKLILLAPPYKDEWINDFEIKEELADFIFDEEKVKQIQEKIEEIYLLHSKDDFVVPFEHAQKYKALMPKIKLVKFQNKPHFLVKKFPELFKYL